MIEIKVSNQIIITFLEKNKKLDSKIESNDPRFLVVAEINNDNSEKKEFIIVLAKTRDELHGNTNKNIKEEIIWKKTTLLDFIKTERILDFEDWYILKQRNGKYFIKKQNEGEDLQVNIEQYQNNKNYYDLNHSRFKEKMKLLCLDLCLDQSEQSFIAEFNDEYMKIKDRKIFLNDSRFKFDDTSERKSLELLQKQWAHHNVTKIQLIKNITFSSDTRKKLYVLQHFQNEVNIELEVEFQLPNKPLTYTFKLDSQKYKIVNCNQLKRLYYGEIYSNFLELESIFTLISEIKADMNQELELFMKNKLPLLKKQKTYLAAAKNFSESYHRNLSYDGYDDLLSNIKQYAAYVINIKNKLKQFQHIENEKWKIKLLNFFDKYKRLKEEFENNDQNFENINRDQNFDHDYKKIALFLLKALNLKKISWGEIQQQFTFNKISHVEVEKYSIKKIGFMEKIGSLINKILIKLKLKKPSATMINSQSKMNEISKIIQSMTEEAQTTISQDSLNSANQEINYESQLFPSALSPDLKFLLDNTKTNSPKELSEICEQEHKKVETLDLKFKNNPSGQSTVCV